eukprot:gene177-833_t
MCGRTERRRLFVGFRNQQGEGVVAPLDPATVWCDNAVVVVMKGHRPRGRPGAAGIDRVDRGAHADLARGRPPDESVAAVLAPLKDEAEGLRAADEAGRGGGGGGGAAPPPPVSGRARAATVAAVFAVAIAAVARLHWALQVPTRFNLARLR